MSSTSTFNITTLEQLSALAQQLAIVLKVGDVVMLEGSLGVGKTTFAQYLCKHLEVQQVVNSPTFVVFQQYESPVGEIIHADCYRKEDDPKFEQKLWALEEKIAQGQSVVLIEWASLVPELKPYATIELQFNQVENTRQLHIKSNRVLDLAEVLI